MGISVWVGKEFHAIGTPSFFKSFFSTIFIHLEDERWGSRFPVVMRELYSGCLKSGQVNEAVMELQTIKEMLKAYSPDQIVWDFENRQAVPPWGIDDDPAITSLSEYFVTSDGKDLFEVLMKAFKQSIVKKQDVCIQ